MVVRFELDQKIGRVAAAAMGRSGNHGNRVDLEANYLTLTVGTVTTLALSYLPGCADS